MTTVAEILHAAEQLDVDDQEELLCKLNVLLSKSRPKSEQTEDYQLPENFTERLTDAFNEARRTAIQRGTR